jgi:hypothetical protein
MVDKNAKCPFYGFITMINCITDQKGNQCALITDRYSPCYMEMEDKTPCWEECKYNKQNPGFVEKLASTEFTVNLEGRDNIPFKQWYEHVMQHGKTLPNTTVEEIVEETDLGKNVLE